MALEAVKIITAVLNVQNENDLLCLYLLSSVLSDQFLRVWW